MLDEILTYKRQQLREIDFRREIEKMSPVVSALPPVRSMSESVRMEDGLSIIAEIKRRSPSKGALRENLKVSDMAREYERAGARAISVLTEDKYFGGSIKDLIDARGSADVPVLRKDFILEDYQVWESRYIGADAILLIVAILTSAKLSALYHLAQRLGLEVLVETHSPEELKTALSIDPEILGINNRNLETFEVDLGTVERLSSLIPGETLLVSESGIHSREDIVRLQECNVDAVLIGEEIVTAEDPYLRICQLRGVTQ